MCRKINSVVRSTHEMVSLPKHVQLPSKRRLEVTPSVLAKKVAKQSDNSSQEVAEKLASEFSWSPEERRQKINIIRGMRAMQRQFCQEIRRKLPMNQTPENIAKFLTELEEKCRSVEDRDSDEFV